MTFFSHSHEITQGQICNILYIKASYQDSLHSGDRQIGPASQWGVTILEPRRQPRARFLPHVQPRDFLRGYGYFSIRFARFKLTSNCDVNLHIFLLLLPIVLPPFPRAELACPNSQHPLTFLRTPLKVSVMTL